MRDALGGTVTLVIIVFFIVVALGYAAFNVNYTKAFRMKDKIIATYEDYSGNCTSECMKIIENYAQKIGYVPYKLDCPGTDWHVQKGDYFSQGLYCEKEVSVSGNSNSSDFDEIKGKTGSSDMKLRKYYRIITKINLQVPVISNILDFKFLYIYGDTKTFEIE
ncbi:MAG: hypothetical protein IJI60_04440 [Bacilli bacterium]|nr:hypothetical protein [Bacilli bacterium]